MRRFRSFRLFCTALLGVITLPALAAPFIYVGNYSTSDVSVFDVVTRQLVATVPVGSRPFPIAVSPDGRRVVVGNSGSNTVSVIETGGNTVVATLGVGANPYGVAISPDSTRAVVVCYDSGTANVIDLTTNTVIMTIALGANPGGVAFNPAGTKVYVTNGGSNSISVIDPSTNTVTKTIANAGVSPWGVIFSHDGTRAFVANFSGANVSVIDAVTDTLVTQWPVGNSPVGVALNGDGSRLYTANSASDTVTILDTTAGFRLNDLPVGHRPFGVAMHPDGRMLSAANAGDLGQPGSVSIFDGAANVVVGTIPTGVFSGGVGNFVSPYTPPGIPTGVSAAPGNHKATVSFVAPFSDGGLAITQYTVTCGTQTRTGNASPVVVDMLANGTSVACTVFATNDRGNGAPSAPVSVTPADVPGAPAITGVMSHDASVTVAFSPPASDGGSAITGYTTACGSASQSGTASPITVGGLVNGTPVTCTVVARNVSGDGPASAASAPVTPVGLPGAPSFVSASRAAGGFATINVTAPQNLGGGTLGGYVASCQPGDFLKVEVASPIVVEGLDDDASYTCDVKAFNEAGPGSPTAGFALAPVPATDVATSVSNGTNWIRGGSETAYTVQVNNAGAAVSGVRVVDSISGDVGTRTWTCTSNGGAACPAASGSGGLDFLVALPNGSGLAITVHVPVPALPETAVTYTVGATVPAGYRDTNAANNSATDGPDVRGLFRSGFE